MRVKAGLAALAIWAAPGAQAATFSFEVLAPSALNRFFGSFEAFDLDSDGMIRSDEVLSFRGRVEGGSPGGPSAWSVDTRYGSSWFSVAYDLDGILGNGPTEHLSFGYTREVTCAEAEGMPATSVRSYSPSASLSHVSLGVSGGSYPDACPEGETTASFAPMQAQVWMEGTPEAPLVVTPVPLAGLLLASGLGLMALRRRVS